MGLVLSIENKDTRTMMGENMRVVSKTLFNCRVPGRTIVIPTLTFLSRPCKLALPTFLNYLVIYLCPQRLCTVLGKGLWCVHIVSLSSMLSPVPVT